MTAALALLLVGLACLTPLTSAIQEYNVTEDEVYLAVVDQRGQVVYMTEELSRKLLEEEEAWHWMPWLRTRKELSENILREVQCVDEFSIESFPNGPFDDDQLRRGAFFLYFMFGVYSFTLLAIVCNDYFIPCVELICEDLKIPQNVAAATFMAVATSCPEFFVNVISTFVTGSDMGIGTIVGSAIFNALGVAAIGGLSAVRPIKIEMRPVTRDVVIYMINVSVLVAIVWDGQVEWYEAMVLTIMYVLYFVFMFNSIRLFRLCDKLVGKCFKKNRETNDRVSIQNTQVESKSVEEGVDNRGFSDSSAAINGVAEKPVETEKEHDAPKKQKSLFSFPRGKSWVKKIWWLYTWPIKLVLRCTVTSPVTCRRFYPFAFFMCIIWIGATSYFVTWSMTVIGHTFLIPESVMGMTFLAFGGCLPEACSIFIMSRKGEGGIGVSNALGANSLAILFALGLPWLIRTLTLLGIGEEPVVLINSSGIGFVVGSLLVAVCCLWITLRIGKFTLRKTVGGVLAVLYAVFITFAILVELNVILDPAIAFC